MCPRSHLLFSIIFLAHLVSIHGLRPPKSNWHFPPFVIETAREDHELDNNNEDEENTISDTDRVKNYADFESNQLLYHSTMAEDVEKRLAYAVSLTRKTRMYFFYGLMLKSYNYMRSLREEADQLVGELDKNARELEVMERSGKTLSSTRMEKKLNHMQYLMKKADKLGKRIEKSTREFNGILDDFMVEVYKFNKRAYLLMPKDRFNQYVQQTID
ncbi:uncharacterized protein LOC141854008 [Brevipalpus obovatus]|uniref:uncharacterized protein LOC141854008 n=1 Tax=Brevipalpus obovatus TaxID=246614 RepID=UPI003D9FAAD8